VFLPVDIQPLSKVALLLVISTSIVLAGGITFLSVRRSSAHLLVLAVASPFLNGLLWALAAIQFWGAFKRFEDLHLLQFAFVTFGLGFLCFIPAFLAVLLVSVVFGRKRD
jgi:hypothetical protein